MARSWLKVEGTVGDHPKIVALAGLYAVHPDLMVGPLVRWWHYCTEYGRAGEPAKCHADVLRSYFAPVVKLSRAVTIPDVVDALRSVRLMDEDGNPNDWQDYGGAILAKRAQDAGRQRVKRAIARGVSEGRHVDVTRQSRGRVEESTATATARDRLPENCRSVYDRYQRAARVPEAFDGTVLGMGPGGIHEVRGATWELIGQAMLEMQGAGEPFNAARLRGYVGRLLRPSADAAVGRETKLERNLRILNQADEEMARDGVA